MLRTSLLRKKYLQVPAEGCPIRVTTQIHVGEDGQTKIGTTKGRVDHPLRQSVENEVEHILPRLRAAQPDQDPPSLILCKKPCARKEMGSNELAITKRAFARRTLESRPA